MSNMFSSKYSAIDSEAIMIAASIPSLLKAASFR
jgi:hypothetical protein